MLSGRRIVLGVTGGVAAYKAAYLARRLMEAGAQVRVIMTRSAGNFIGPQTFAAITGTQPITDFFGSPEVSPHTDLAAWADAVVIAPATAATLSRIAAGLAEDPLVATVLATTAPIVAAPAMHTEMWEHPATQRNVESLRSDGVRIVGPVVGALAGGDEGTGRMAEPEEILAAIGTSFPADLGGWDVLVSAGGTREAIDPVRFLGNRSSGKMGNAIAIEAAGRGAKVTLVTATEPPDHHGVDIVRVESADDMAEAVWSRAGSATAAILAAAIADFRPTQPKVRKLKRAEGVPEIDLEPTPDILAGVAAMDPRPLLVGFAAETGSLDDAIDKAKHKGVDLLVANDVARAGSGFSVDTNQVTLITPDGATDPWPLMTKDAVAARLWDRIVTLRSEGRGT